MGDFFTALQSAASFANDAMNYANSLVKKAGEEKARSFALDFSTALNDKMTELSARGDYENFDEEINNLYDQYRNNGNAEAPNKYGAKLINDYLDQSYLSSRANIQQLQVQALKNNINLQAEEDTTKIIASDMDMQQAMYAIVDVRDGQLANNTNGADTHNKYQLNIASDISTLYSQRLENRVNAVFNNGGNLDDAMKEIENFMANNMDYSVTDVMNFSVENIDGKNVIAEGSGKVSVKDLIDLDNVTNTAKSKAKIIWNTQVTEMQKQNANSLSEMRTNILLEKNTSNISNMIDRMEVSLLSMKGNKLREEDRNQYASWLASMRKTMESSDQTTAQGNSAVKVAAFKGLTNSMDAYVTAAFNGEFDNLYCAKEAWVNDNYDSIVEERYGGDKSKYSLDQFMYDYVNEIESFTKAVKSSGKIPDEAKGLLDNYEKVAVAIVKSSKGFSNDSEAKSFIGGKNSFFEVESEKLKSLIMDYVMECNMADPTAVSGIIDRYTAQVNALYLDTYDYSIQRGLLKPSEEKQIANVVGKLQEDTSAYTTGDGIGEVRREQFAPGVKEAVAENAGLFKSKIAEAAGIDASNLTMTYEKTQYDINANPVFMDDSGNQYRLNSTGDNYEVQKKSANGKWETVKTIEESKSAYGQYRDREEYYNTLAYDFMDTGIVPPSVSEKVYKRMQIPQKRNEWKKWVTANPEEAEKLRDKYIGK